MRYAIYGGSSHLNRSVSNSVSRTQKCAARIFFNVDELQTAIESGPVIDILMLTDPTSDPDLPLLVAWLKKQPGSRQPRIVTLRQKGAPSTDMDLIQIDNVTQTATAHKKVSFFRMPQGGNIFADAGRTKAVIFDANNGLLLKVFGRYEFQSDNKVVVDHTPVQLTNKLFQLAWYLFGQVNQQLSREVLYESVWGNYGDPASRSLDTHVSMLRSQLHLFSGNEYVLEAIYGRGYSLKKNS